MVGNETTTRKGDNPPRDDSTRIMEIVVRPVLYSGHMCRMSCEKSEANLPGPPIRPLDDQARGENLEKVLRRMDYGVMDSLWTPGGALFH